MSRPVASAAASRARGELAKWLLEQRAHAGLSYRALAERTGYSPATLQRVGSTTTVPQERVVVAYAEACGASGARARELWRTARSEARRATRGRTLPAPLPGLVRDFADLSAALKHLYEKAGAPSLREMEHRGGGHGILPRSTLYRMLRKEAGVPRHRRQFEAFLRACQLPEPEWSVWLEAWDRSWKCQQNTYALDAAPQQSLQVLPPSLIRNLADLGLALRAAHAAVGQPSPAAMAQRARAQSMTLPPSFIAEVLDDRLWFFSKRYLRPFLYVCAIPKEQWSTWNDAWTRAWQHEQEAFREERLRSERALHSNEATNSFPVPAADPEPAAKPRRQRLAPPDPMASELKQIQRDMLSNSNPPPGQDQLVTMLGKNRAVVLRAIHEYPHNNPAAINSILSLAPGGVSWHAEALEEAGLITITVHDGNVRYAVTPLAIAMITAVPLRGGSRSTV
ncbi:helix-turn-helix domain-containing protein [Streptomyces sp. NPDC093060]|uniref:helix-turn-helix domain-containing protein n=1 Tax=Streptomyces sp. NPDC093060 TaxID=3366019 RepID=UPI0037F1D428